MRKQIILLSLTLVSFSLFAQVPTNGLMAWYKFNGNSGDSSGNGNHGTVNGATLTSDRFGNVNKAYYFNGSNNYILVPSSSSIQPLNALSVSIWFYPESNSNQWQPLVCKHISTSFPYDSYLLGTGTPFPVSNKWYGVISNGSTISQNAISKNSTYDAWVFLVFTYDGSFIKTYINGKLDTTNTFSSTIGYNPSVGLYIGHNGTGGQFFKGAIDDITIHNRALSACEIKKMYYSVSIPNPKANFTITSSSSQCLPNNVFNFKDSSIWQLSTLSRLWNFGESPSDNSSARNTSKTYLASGLQNIKLIVTDSFGCVDSIVKQVTVFDSPKVGVNVNYSNQCLVSNSFQFDNTIAYNTSGAKYLWNFSSVINDTSTKINPTKTYSNSGVNNVKLKIVFTNGCSDSAYKTVNVFNAPDPSFTLSDSLVCISNDSITIKTTITGGSFTGATVINGVFHPTDTGMFKITYTIGNGNCIDSTSKFIHVFAMPDASFSMSDSIVCVGANPIVFTPKNMNGLFSGEPLSSNIFKPIKSGTFLFTYTLSNSKCIATTTKKIIVANKPKASFTYSPDTNYVNIPVNFIPDTIGIKSFLWNFGDGSSDSIIFPSHTFKTENIFKVWLKVTSKYGCEDSTYRDVKISNKKSFAVPNVFSPNNDNVNDKFLIKSSSIDKYHISIYNRWGSLVYESNNIEEGWDGTFMQQPCSDAVYYYIANIIDTNHIEQNIYGTVTLIR
ncbi:MAG: gliding motility-associated C-terminal domain-containing protein [Bacteroidetes bacterium]|nr:gliding motility-associated C-terminal domain-containing protein [Bacteroidota bacterium]